MQPTYKVEIVHNGFVLELNDGSRYVYHDRQDVLNCIGDDLALLSPPPKPEPVFDPAPPLDTDVPF